jgi:hypothetical protein
MKLYIFLICQHPPLLYVPAARVQTFERNFLHQQDESPPAADDTFHQKMVNKVSLRLKISICG